MFSLSTLPSPIGTILSELGEGSVVKIGFYATGSKTSGYRELLDQVEYADDVGFDSVWLRERHFHTDAQGRNFFSSPFVAAAYIAARTQRIRIGMGARILSLDHPIHIAEDGATVDVISNGRLDLGIARIGENELYQKAFGITAEETRDRFEEAAEVIVRAWTQEQFSYDGKYYPVTDVCVAPKPIQKPHPPIYMVGIGSSSLEYGAKRGLPLLMAAAQTETILADTQSKYFGLLRESGYRSEDVVLPVNRFIYVGESHDEAIADTRETIMRFIHRKDSVIRDFLFLPPEEITYELLFNEVFIIGDADECLERIERVRDSVDLRHVMFSFNYFTIDHEKCRRSMERFVDHVMPRLTKKDPDPIRPAGS